MTQWPLRRAATRTSSLRPAAGDNDGKGKGNFADAAAAVARRAAMVLAAIRKEISSHLVGERRAIASLRVTQTAECLR